MQRHRGPAEGVGWGGCRSWEPGLLAQWMDIESGPLRPDTAFQAMSTNTKILRSLNHGRLCAQIKVQLREKWTTIVAYLLTYDERYPSAFAAVKKRVLKILGS